MKNNQINVNLGCGPSGLNSWINFDWGVLPFLSKFPRVRKILVDIGLLTSNYITDWPRIKLVDIRKKLPLSNNSVDNIYCSHVLEHFEFWEAKSILSECKRVLKRNGRIRIVLPNLKKMVNQYKNANDFCREFYGFNKDVLSIGRKFIRGHQWMYDDMTAVKLLKDSGFVDIKILKRAVGKVPNINELDVKINEPLSLYIEAINK